MRASFLVLLVATWGVTLMLACSEDESTAPPTGATASSGGGGSSAGGGTTVGSGGSAGAGGAATCSVPGDCPGTDTSCRQRSCDAGLCGVVDSALGTACSDNGGQLCDGAGTCVPPSCTDGLLASNETDVDCGGVCPSCVLGSKCVQASDCTSNLCAAPGSGSGGSGGGQAGAGGAGGGSASGGGVPGPPVCSACASDADCGPVTNTWCDAGVCVVIKALGDACAADNECGSGFCAAADGVCCNNACDSLCEACTAAKTGGADGSCGFVSAMTDPDSECADAGPASCGSNGAGCSGTANACVLYDSATVCIAAVCSGGQQTTDGMCNGAGVCNPGTTSGCGSYLCNGAATACLTDCNGGGDADCGDGYFCSAGTCIPRIPNGDNCSDPSQCNSGFCFDGKCCNRDCSANCVACSAAKNGASDGVCDYVPDGDDPDGECPGSQTCDGAGVCGNLVNGSVCTAGTECASGFCADGVCCNAACDLTCEACVAVKTGGSDGTCALIPGGTDPDTECADQGAASCGSNGSGCSGTQRRCALYAAGTTCTMPQCMNAALQPEEQCDGNGACVEQKITTCIPYACNGGANGCLNDCSVGGDADCAAGFFCNTGVCSGQQPNGFACGTGADCQSGNCVDGVCCNNACDGSCEACLGALTGGIDGTCASLPLGTDPDMECAAGQVCDGAGNCKGDLGVACGTGADCLGSQCSDGVCCDEACGGSCRACVASKTGLVDGQCGGIVPDTDPDNECSGGDVCGVDQTCGGSCDSHSCVLDSDCDAASTGGDCGDVGGDCNVASCVGGVPAGDTDAGEDRDEDLSTWEFNQDIANNTTIWYCTRALPVTADGVLTDWQLRVTGNQDVARLAVLRCTDSVNVYTGCSRVGLGPSQTATGGTGVHTFSLAGSTQLDGATPDGSGIVVQAGDILCARSPSNYNIYVDCDGADGGVQTCPGSTLLQYAQSIDSIGQPFALTDSSYNGHLAVKAWGVTPEIQGTCSETAPEPDTTLCSVNGGDTCCGGACVSGPGGAGTCN